MESKRNQVLVVIDEHDLSHVPVPVPVLVLVLVAPHLLPPRTPDRSRRNGARGRKRGRDEKLLPLLSVLKKWGEGMKEALWFGRRKKKEKDEGESHWEVGADD